jgi:hypothetical protein
MPRKKSIQTPPVDPLVVDEETKQIAAYVALVVRNVLDPFTTTYLSDDQVAELNPLPRNAICTAFHTYTIGADSDSTDGQAFVVRHMSMIPADEEKPRLTDDFVAFIRHRQDRQRGLR